MSCRPIIYLTQDSGLIILIVVAIVSLAIAQLLVNNRSAATFYLLPSRGWELLIGVLVAFYLSNNTYPKIGKFVSQTASAIGLLLIIYALFAFNKKTPFPSFYTLVPTIGTALIILFATQQTIVGRLLSNKFFVGIGLISYSAYLWHQPLFAFARHRSLDRPSNLIFTALIVTTLILAYFSWKYIETPFREKWRFNQKQIFTYGIVGSIFFFIIGLIGHFTDGFLKQRATETQLSVLKTAISSPRRGCHTGGVNYRKPKDACEYHEGELLWATFGDSHAVELSFALANKLKPFNIKLKQFSFSGCVPSYGRDIPELPYCSRWTEEAVNYISDSKEIKNVVVSYRIHGALFGAHGNKYPELPNELSDAEREKRWDSYINLLQHFLSKGKNVVFVLQAPELPKPIETLLFRALVPLSEVVGVNRSWWDERTKYVSTRLSQISSKVKIIDPTDLFCNQENCFAARGGIAYYFDDNHMSVDGASLVADEIIEMARQTSIIQSNQ
jgi:hypothetical protein